MNINRLLYVDVKYLPSKNQTMGNSPMLRKHKYNILKGKTNITEKKS
jgi:hypothetical protein